MATEQTKIANKGENAPCCVVKPNLIFGFLNKLIPTFHQSLARHCCAPSHTFPNILFMALTVVVKKQRNI
jgi:hypothetical protein